MMTDMLYWQCTKTLLTAIPDPSRSEDFEYEIRSTQVKVKAWALVGLADKLERAVEQI